MKRLVLFSLFSVFLVVESAVTHHIFWNSSNVHFDTFDGAIDSPGYYEISASTRDFVKFHCPKRRSREYSLVYQVSLGDFEQCTLSAGSEVVGRCDGHHNAFTIPLKNLKKAKDERVFYITTSTGTMSGLHNKKLGLCLERNLRLAVGLGLPETVLPSLLAIDKTFQVPLEGVYSELQLESKGLDGNLYLIEENKEIHWKKNVHPNMNKDLNDKIKKTMKFDKNKEMEPIPIAYEYFTEKLEEMQTPGEDYHHPRRQDYNDWSINRGSGDRSWLLAALSTLYILL